MILILSWRPFNWNMHIRPQDRIPDRWYYDIRRNRWGYLDELWKKP